MRAGYGLVRSGWMNRGAGTGCDGSYGGLPARQIDYGNTGWWDGEVKLDPAAVELLAVRSAVLNEYAFHNPNEKALNKPASEKEWKDLSKRSVDLSKDLIAEATKKAPDLKVLRQKLTLLDGACTDCHGKYRFDE